MKNGTMMRKAVTLITYLLIFGLFACQQRNSISEDSRLKFLSPIQKVAVENQQEQAKRLIGAEPKISDLIAKMTLDEKLSLIHADSKFTIASIPRLGIPKMTMSDGPHGVRYEIMPHQWKSAERSDDYATYLPTLMSVAASFDVNMANLHGDVLGSEARFRGKDFILGPGVNIARLPLNGRTFEYMGEDPYLVSKLVVPEIQAIQSHDVAATVKHYALNSQELNRIGVNALPTERTLREVYLPAFKAAVQQANVQAVMGSYNQYFGTNANQSKHLVRDILKSDWGFNGVLMTDWNVDINSKDAAINGLDIEMGTDKPYSQYHFAEPLKQLVQRGTVPIRYIDDKVRRILRVQMSIGMYDEKRDLGSFNTPEHRKKALKIAQNGVVLLKNQQILPFDNRIKHILVTGPNADRKHALGGGSSEVKTKYEVTPLQGLKNRLGNKVIIDYMQLKPSRLVPIESDFVSSRHWTGTPAWQLYFYQDTEFSKLLEHTWQADPMLSVDALKSHNIKLTGSVTPTSSGIHQFQLKVTGKYQLNIDGKTLISGDNNNSEIVSKAISLHQGKAYQIELLLNTEADFILGWQLPNNEYVSPQKFYEMAKKVDAVVYFGGLSHADDRESIDRTSLTLPNQQDEIIEKLININPQTVVFLIAGSPVTMPWKEQVNALLWSSYAGMEGGNAFADVLAGKVNPSGKLPITFAKQLTDYAAIKLNDYNSKEMRYKEGVFIGYKWFEQQQIPVLFPFGYGLSYSQFDYSNIQCSTYHLYGKQALVVSANITNKSDRAGQEVVQLYLHDQQASIPRPYKELRGIHKISLQPKETKLVTFVINKADLSYWDESQNDWFAEPGKFDVLIGASSQDIKLKATFEYHQ